MKKYKRCTRLKISTIVLLILMLTFFTEIIGFETTEAQPGTGGPITIWGQVYTSEGIPVGPEYDGTYAAVIIEHDGERTTHYDDKGGLEYGIYTVTIPEGDWSQGDLYWVIIDGLPWGDLKENEVEGIKITPEQEVIHSGTDNWVLSGPSDERRDVITLAEEPDTLENLEPLIAAVFTIIILLLGILFMVVLPKHKINVVIMERKEYGLHRKRGKQGMFGYICGYGHPKKPIVIGEIFGASSKIDVDSKQTISVQKIIRLKNGEYNWYKPKIVFKEPPSRIDTAEEIDNFWFLGGKVELEKGESHRHAAQVNTAKRFCIFILPFIILELLLGTVSVFGWVKWVAVPPWLGLVFLMNLIILVIGVLVPFWLYWRVVMVKRVDRPLVDMPEIISEEESILKTENISPLTIQPVPNPGGVIGGSVEDYPITPQKYLPPANLNRPLGGDSGIEKTVISPSSTQQQLSSPQSSTTGQTATNSDQKGGNNLTEGNKLVQQTDSRLKIAQPVKMT
jgi:hypothetical protein